MPLLEVDNVSVRFGGIHAVSEATFEVDGARVQGLIGPNGAGKTTTFNVITGLQTPTDGRIRFLDQDVTSRSLHERARMGLARTFQRLEVFGSLSVFDNVRVAIEIHRSWSDSDKHPRREAARLLELVGVSDFAGVQADAVPTGIARLTELARALAIQPKVLLLDEPSSGLNEEETQDFGELLTRLAGDGMGILMVEHDVDLVMRVCEWIDVLDFGRIIARGTPAEIRENEDVRAAYLGTEADEAEVA